MQYLKLFNILISFPIIIIALICNYVKKIHIILPKSDNENSAKLLRYKLFRRGVHKSGEKLIKIAYIVYVDGISRLGNAVLAGAEQIARLSYPKIIFIGDRRHIFVSAKQAAEVALPGVAHGGKLLHRNVLEVVIFEIKDPPVNRMMLRLCTLIDAVAH